MKKVSLCLVLAVVVAGAAFAHPPVIGAVAYDSATRLLSVELVHDLSKASNSDPAKHFVKEVDLLLGGAKAVVQVFSSQETAFSFKVVYRLPLSQGDKLSIQAACSIFGTATKEYTLP